MKEIQKKTNTSETPEASEENQLKTPPSDAMKKKPLLSIFVLTYNQQDYIRSCLDGILMQQCDFEYEFIIIDDVSTDNTPDIIKEYAAAHPSIRAVFNKTNVYSKGLYYLISGMRDQNIRGKYFAICEGDDYWTDPLKLQKQVDFMEAYPECSICSHKTKVVFEDQSKTGFTMEIKGVETPQVYSLEEYIQGKAMGFWTVSQLYRTEVISDVPEWVYQAPFGDLPLKLHAGLQGKMGYIPEEMAVYRRGVPGAWSENEDSLEWNIKHITDRNYIYDLFDKHTNYRYHKLVHETNRKWVLQNITKIQHKFGRAAQPRLLFKHFKYLTRLDKQTLSIWLRLVWRR